MQLHRLAIISVHASPLASFGGQKTGGLNVYLRELAKEFGRRGIEVDIFTRRTAPDFAVVDTSLGPNVRVINVRAGPPQNLPPAEIYQHLSQFTAGVIAFATKASRNYDLMYSHYWLSGWVGSKLKEVWGIPFLHMYHTLGHMKNRIIPGYTPTGIPDVRINVETQILNWVDRIIAATPAEQTQLLWLYRADRRKIRVVPPGVDLKRFSPIPIETAKSALGIPEKSNLLLFVGRVEPLKAVGTILEALSCVRQRAPHLLKDIRLAIIGGDPGDSANAEMIRLQTITQRLYLDRIVHFVGATDNALLPNYYAAATAVIMPSDYESFGMVAVEAMASGTPVIASEVGGLAYLINDGETGFLVPVREPTALADRIMTLLSTPAKREVMGHNAFNIAKQYAWPRIADQLLAVFDEIGKRPPAQSSRHTH